MVCNPERKDFKETNILVSNFVLKTFVFKIPSTHLSVVLCGAHICIFTQVSYPVSNCAISYSSVLQLPLDFTFNRHFLFYR